MKFSYFRAVIKSLTVCLGLGLSAFPFFIYGYNLWQVNTSSDTSSNQPTTTANKAAASTTVTPTTTTATTHSFASSISSDQGQFWPELRKSFRIEHYSYNYQVREQIAWFQNHPKWLNRTLNNAAPYMYYVYTQVVKRNLPGELVLLPVIESAYDPFAYSNRGAAGLWQLMPGTASGYGLKQDWWYDGRRDIYASTNAALDYFSYLQNFFSGNWLYSLAAYNAGQGTVQNAINYNAERDRNTEFWTLPLPSQTVSYVPQLLALAAIISDPEEYHVNLPPLTNGPYYAEVNVGKQINLTTAARMANISVHELYRLNPGYNRWATDPNGPSLLMLPVDRIDAFKNNIVQMPIQTQPQPVLALNHYQVRSGDTLNSIARQFGTQIASLQQANKLNSNIIHSGQTLLIPQQSSSNNKSSYSTSAVTESNHLSATNTTAEKYQTIQVNKGDSLWSLALKYQVQPNQIQAWNHLTANTPLKVGENLVIYHNQAVMSSTPTTTIGHAKTSQPAKNTSYKVVSGDTLDTIARKFGTSAKAIEAYNNLKNSNLHLGQTLSIPTGNHSVNNAPPKPVVATNVTQSSAANKNSATSHNSTTAKESSSVIRYTVVSGDTLDHIAKKFGTSAKAIEAYNNLKNANLHLGQTLSIPTGNHSVNNAPTKPEVVTNVTLNSVDNKKSSLPHNTVKQSSSVIRYTVVSGDTLDTIARKFGTSAKAIEAYNGLKNSNLHLGQNLSVPTMSLSANNTQTQTTTQKSSTPHSTAAKQATSLIRYTVKPGDTLASIAHAHQVTVNELQSWNKAYLGKYLHNGQILVIYK